MMFAQFTVSVALVIGAHAAPLPSDTNTALGSKLLNTSLPVATIAFGFDGCDMDMLMTGLRQHRDAVGGTSVTKDYFTSKMRGHCNRFAVKHARKQNLSAYHTYINSCYRGMQPGRGRTTVDVSPSYAFHAEEVIQQTKEMENDVSLRFLAVVCDPIVRAIHHLKEHMQTNNAQAMTYGKMSSVFADELRKDAHGIESEIITQGNYAKILAGFVSQFPKESLLVINSDKLSEKATWKRIYEHIGVLVPEEKRIAKGMQLSFKNEKPLSLLDPEILKRLKKHYNAYDTVLWEMLGSKFW